MTERRLGRIGAANRTEMQAITSPTEPPPVALLQYFMNHTKIKKLQGVNAVSQ